MNRFSQANATSNDSLVNDRILSFFTHISSFKIISTIIALSILLKLACIGVNDLLVEEAYYWNYAQHLDFSYLDHPPMVAVLIKLSSMLFGLSEFSVRFPSLLCWILTAIFNVKLTRLISPNAGTYALLS